MTTFEGTPIPCHKSVDRAAEVKRITAIVNCKDVQDAGAVIIRSTFRPSDVFIVAFPEISRMSSLSNRGDWVSTVEGVPVSTSPPMWDVMLYRRNWHYGDMIVFDSRGKDFK